MTGAPDPRFVQAIQANLTYWRRCLQQWASQSSFAQEYPHLERAVSFGLVRPETQPAAAKLILQAHPFVERQGLWPSWLPLQAQAIATCSPDQVWLRGKLLNSHGQMLRRAQNWSAAIPIHLEAEAVARQQVDADALVEALFNLSEDYRDGRQYQEATLYARDALEVAQTMSDAGYWLAAIQNTLGLIAHELGRQEEAAAWLEEAVVGWRRHDNQVQLARSLNNLANVWTAMNKAEKALAAYDEAAALLAGTDGVLDKVRIHLSQGSLYFQLGRYKAAEAAFRRADSPALQRSGDVYLRATQAQNLGNVLLQQGRLAEAEWRLQHSLAGWRTLKDNLMLANTLGTLAEVMGRQGQTAVAAAHYDEALKLLADRKEPIAGRLRAAFTAARDKLSENLTDSEG